ncbi:hypothetical protein E2C01_095664 [Portunus trituberculatus]|uniref:Uncharacterized protein n=1 Tax=Portunus trituberculatus TaxID=210409 RepID=A0A5B7JZZ1_PORTR|nr:hypothetical protein [Portunus trituberculatus]
MDAHLTGSSRVPRLSISAAGERSRWSEFSPRLRLSVLGGDDSRAARAGGSERLQYRGGGSGWRCVLGGGGGWTARGHSSLTSRL